VVGELAKGFQEFEVKPRSPWNYALKLDAREPAKSFELLVDAKTPPAHANPFDANTTPVKLVATARKLPQWGLAWNGVVAFDPPASPVRSDEPDERVTLVPYGSQDLRLTDFPVLGDPPPPPTKPLAFNFDDNTTTGWTWLGGGWWAHDGKLRTAHMDGGAPGYKALVENFACADFRIDAAVTPPPAGDAGVIFRVAKASVGADAYRATTPASAPA